MQTQLRSRMLDDATISGEVGTRVDWNVRPQGKPLPAVTMNLIADRRDQHMGGLQVTRGTFTQIDVWAEDAAALATVREGVVSLIATGAVEGGITFLPATDIEVSEGIERDDLKVIHRSTIRATIWHTVIP